MQAATTQPSAVAVNDVTRTADKRNFIQSALFRNNMEIRLIETKERVQANLAYPGGNRVNRVPLDTVSRASLRSLRVGPNFAAAIGQDKNMPCKRQRARTS